MKDLGAAKQILGMRITRDRKNRKLTLSQSEYIEKVLKRFNMQNEKPVGIPLASHFKLSMEACPKAQEEMAHIPKAPYASAVRSLMYAMVCTRHDVAHAVGVVSRYMNNPGKENWVVVKWILRYLIGTTNQALCFGGSNIALQGYVDEDMAGNRNNNRAQHEASKEMIWLQRLMDELGKKQELVKLYSDNRSAIHIAKNSTFHSKTKHIHLKYHFIWSALEDGQLKLEKIHTSQNPADILTKVVTKEKLRICSVSIGLQL
eukprot:PITA_33547